jgi:hypothetical protein
MSDEIRRLEDSAPGSASEAGPELVMSIDGRVQIGTPRRVAYALAVFPIDTVQRTTIRAMLPPGTTRRVPQAIVRKAANRHGSKNRVSIDFGQALKVFADRGWIDRGEVLLRIRDRDALRAHALNGLPGVPDRFIALEQAVTQLRAQAADRTEDSRALAVIRLRELRAIEQLMRSGASGSNWSGRGSVRFPHKGRVL